MVLGNLQMKPHLNSLSFRKHGRGNRDLERLCLFIKRHHILQYSAQGCTTSKRMKSKDLQHINGETVEGSSSAIVLTNSAMIWSLFVDKNVG